MLGARAVLRRGFGQAPKRDYIGQAKGLVQWAIRTVGEVYQDTQEYVKIGRTKGWKVELKNHHLFTTDELFPPNSINQTIRGMNICAEKTCMKTWFMTENMITERLEKWRQDRLAGFEELNQFVDLNGTRYSPSLDDLPPQALEALCKIWLKEYRPGYLFTNFLYTAFVKSPFLLASWVAKKRGDPNHERFKDFPWCKISFKLNTGPLSLYKRNILQKQLRSRLESLKVEDSILSSNPQSLDGLSDSSLLELSMDRLWTGANSDAKHSADWLKTYWLGSVSSHLASKSDNRYPEQFIWDQTRRAYKSLTPGSRRYIRSRYGLGVTTCLINRYKSCNSKSSTVVCRPGPFHGMLRRPQ